MVDRNVHRQTRSSQGSWAVSCFWEDVQVYKQEGQWTKPPSGLSLAKGFSCCWTQESWGTSAICCCSSDEPVTCLLWESRCSSRQGHKFPIFLLKRDLHSLLLYSLPTFTFSLEITKWSHAEPRSYQPFVIWKRQQHCFHVFTTHSRSQLPVCLQVFMLLGTGVADSLAFPRPHCCTLQQGRNRKGLKNDRKKENPQLTDEPPKQSNLFG